MKFVFPGKTTLGVLFLLALIEVAQSAPLARNLLSADEVIQKAMARAQQAQASSGKAAYTYTKLTLMEELDSAGKVKERKEKVYQVNFHNGSSQVKLLQVNGRPPSEADLKKQAENDSNARQMTGSSKSNKGDRENFLTPDVVARFDFALLEQTNINGRATYQVAFQPKNPPPPTHRMVDRLLDRISGTVWIDAQEFEIARADLQLGSEVNLLGGVIGSLKKLVYSMSRTRIADGLWFNTSSVGDFEGRKLIDAMRIKTQSHSINFRPLS